MSIIDLEPSTVRALRIARVEGLRLEGTKFRIISEDVSFEFEADNDCNVLTL